MHPRQNSLALLAAVLVSAAAPARMRAQVVRIGGGASTIADSQGAAITVYQTDATTQASLGYAQGIHLGASREVRNSTTFLAAGDGSISFDLPTDLSGEGRVLSVRGVMLGTLDQRAGHLSSGSINTTGRSRFSANSFTGWTGDGYRNAFFASVAPTHPISFATARMRVTDRFELSSIAVRGSENSFLTSVAFALHGQSSAALSAGFSGGKPVLRMSAHGGGASWQIDGNYTSTVLHLQPEPTLASLSLERIGWNINGSKRLGNFLWIDAARHEFATSAAADAASAGLTAGRSVLYEAGTTLRMGHAEAGGRLLQSTSGPSKSSGVIMIAGWNTPRWNIRATHVANTGTAGDATASTSIDTTESFGPHLKLTEGTSFGNGAPTFDFGMEYGGRLGVLNISHRETYVPFGNQAGLHRVLAVGVRLHLGRYEVGADTVTGGGLRNIYNLTVDTFYGGSLGAMAPHSSMSALPRFAIRGRVVTTDGAPVRGAAVAAGSQTVFTDSEGRFFARFPHADTVRVAIEPAAFLTPENYKSAGGARLAQTRPELLAEDIELKVQRCNACGEETSLNTHIQDESSEATPSASQRSGVHHNLYSLPGLVKRMFTLRARA